MLPPRGTVCLIHSKTKTLQVLSLSCFQNHLTSRLGLIARKQKYDSISATLRDALHWLSIRQHVEFKLSVRVFNCMHNLAPSYLSTMCQPVVVTYARQHVVTLAVPATGQLRRGRTVHLELSSSTATHLPAAFCGDLKTELFSLLILFALVKNFLLLYICICATDFGE